MMAQLFEFVRELPIAVKLVGTFVSVIFVAMVKV